MLFYAYFSNYRLVMRLVLGSSALLGGGAAHIVLSVAVGCGMDIESAISYAIGLDRRI